MWSSNRTPSSISITFLNLNFVYVYVIGAAPGGQLCSYGRSFMIQLILSLMAVSGVIIFLFFKSAGVEKNKRGRIYLLYISTGAWGI